MIIGYTAGAFDLIHIGHIRHLKLAKSKCDYLIVGISTDDFIKKIKNKNPIFSLEERIEIVNSIKYVDKTIIQYDENKFEVWEQYKFNIMFSGDDWKGNPRFEKYRLELEKVGAKLEFLPYTYGISTTDIINKILTNNDKF
ncbi:adenylyltransferase/cytidyltransferase family protein [Brachyspira intermedia]|uniref:adenylyltransferase/cytidyltransferase family protein n=1 Tax=Brachyspira intermedia TaxID=84377 RepID=UPI0030055396